MVPRAPTHDLTRAQAVLRTRRRIAFAASGCATSPAGPALSQGREGRGTAARRLGRSGRVDGILGEVREDLVRVLLLNERLLDQTLRFREAQLLGPGEQGAVAGDLVMLDRLSRRDQARIRSLAALELLE